MKQSNHLQFDGHLTFAAESCTAIKTGTTEDTAAYAQAQENLPICLLAYAVPIHACIRQQDTSSHAPDFESSAQLGFGTIASGGSRTQNLWGRLVEAEGPSHICYSKIPLVLSKPVGPDGPTDYTWICH
jgi:hypothetical protein